MSTIAQVTQHGQSIWFDYIQRGMIWDGSLFRMTRDDAVRGVTSNPSIFQKAIAGSDDYGPALKAKVKKGGNAGELFEMVAVRDIQLAADTLRWVYDDTCGRDGYVSLEVSPFLADDTEATVAEAARLWDAVCRDNVMIKIPATEAGLPAIERTIAAGINVNVTLLFAVEYYDRVHERYMAGLERLAATGGDVSRVASVASFFVSRIDAKVDKIVGERLAQSPDADTTTKLESLCGEVAIANAKMAYRSYKNTIASDRWRALAAKGAQTQRVLWASTGTKNPKYPDTLYVDRLIGPDTVNTVPEKTFDAFKDHGTVAPALLDDMDGAAATMARMTELDISMKAITDTLLDEGVVAFADAFDKLLSTVETRRREFLGDGLGTMRVDAPAVAEKIGARLESMRKSGFTRAFWKKDARLYGRSDAFDPDVSGFMGWLDVGDRVLARRTPLERIRSELAEGGYERVVLMGMGGSSLAPEVFARILGSAPGSPTLEVLDSTVPAQVAGLAERVAGKKTAFIVASKSGSTTEPMSFAAFFSEKIGDDHEFMAITDPGSKLERMARTRGFRRIFSGDPAVGGRYSALSKFGMVPVAATGGDFVDLLERAHMMEDSCHASVPAADNPGVHLGVALGELALAGRDKLTILATSGLSALGCWLEQLVAESTGKQGKGIIPVDGEALAGPELYGDDRVFAYLRLKGDEAMDDQVAALAAAGHPVITFDVNDNRDIVQEMYRWEVATAVAGQLMGINPFDQPNVQESKDYTRQFLDAFTADGALPEVPGERELLDADGVKVFADEVNAGALGGATGLAALLRKHIDRAGAGDYLAINAYVDMNAANSEALQSLRHRLRQQRKVATTLGFGPRFLHSTGQIHKGGPNSGVFLQITCDDQADLPIPGQSFTFGVLKTAQANGDFAALSKRGRRLLRLHLSDVSAGLAALVKAIG